MKFLNFFSLCIFNIPPLWLQNILCMPLILLHLLIWVFVAQHTVYPRRVPCAHDMNEYSALIGYSVNRCMLGTVNSECCSTLLHRSEFSEVLLPLLWRLSSTTVNLTKYGFNMMLSNKKQGFSSVWKHQY